MPPVERLRTDLAIAEVEGDLVVYEPEGPTCHVLAGGAVLVVAELDGGTTDGLVERLRARVVDVPEDFDSQVHAFVDDLRARDLLEPVEPDDSLTRAEAGVTDTSPRLLRDPPAP